MEISKETAEKIAIEYGLKVGLPPIEVVGSEFDNDSSPAVWHVLVSYCEPQEPGHLQSFIIHVEDSTGIASHVMQLFL